MIKIIGVLALVAVGFVEPACAAGFQLKGLAIGMSAKEACGEAEITDKLGDLIRQYKAEAPSLQEMGTTECEVRYPSFGGSALAGPAKLLFMDDKLISVRLELEGLSLASFLDIYKALLKEYGKSKWVKSDPFVTDTWRRDGQTLLLERLGREWDDNDVLIIWRHEKSAQAYQTRYDANTAVLKRLDANRIRSDIR